MRLSSTGGGRPGIARRTCASALHAVMVTRPAAHPARARARDRRPASWPRVRSAGARHCAAPRRRMRAATGDGGNIAAIDRRGGRGRKRRARRRRFDPAPRRAGRRQRASGRRIRPQHGVRHAAGSERGLDLEVRGVWPAALVLEHRRRRRQLDDVLGVVALRSVEHVALERRLGWRVATGEEHTCAAGNRGECRLERVWVAIIGLEHGYLRRLPLAPWRRLAPERLLERHDRQVHARERCLRARLAS